MAKITANQSSLLKKLPVQGSELADEQKALVSLGKEYIVVETGEDVNGHLKVTLGYGAGTWYIYKEHWDGLTPDGGSILPVRYFNAITIGTLTAPALAQAARCCLSL